MDDLVQSLEDLDPDINYFNPIISESQKTINFHSFEEYNNAYNNQI